MQRDLVAESAEFRGELSERAERALMAEEPGRSDLLELLRTYLNEVPVALDVLAPVLGPGTGRVLEVGSGIGAVAHCLSELGFDVIGIEPGGPGFEDLLLVQRTLADIAASLRSPAAKAPRILELGVEALNPEEHGRFDVVFSINVLEHVDDAAVGLGRMQSVLTESGVQRHVCPNYAFPYEPHFFIPLVPALPALTRKLLPRSITASGLWASLNFVTGGQVRRWAAEAGVSVVLDPGVLADAVERYASDPIFARRHAGLGWIVHVLRRVGLMELIRRLPPGLVSPMRITVRPAP